MYLYRNTNKPNILTDLAITFWNRSRCKIVLLWACLTIMIQSRQHTTVFGSSPNQRQPQKLLYNIHITQTYTYTMSHIIIFGLQSLPSDQRKLYPSNLTAPDGGTYPVCIVSGWPVIDTKKSNAVTFENGRMAIKDDWTKVMTASKTVQSSAVKQTLEFIAKWCGPPVQQYSFHWTRRHDLIVSTDIFVYFLGGEGGR